jgi:ElaB/YqjD/DUF883 family membrane-anchored ribosome-binding protein
MGSESPEVIEQQMQETRESLTQKVAALETQVLGTITTASEAVTNIVETVKTVVPETIHSVKDTVSESVNAVKEQVASTFDLSAHTRNNPWAMVGGACAAGFLVGLLLPRREPALGTAPGYGQQARGTAPQPAYAPQAPSTVAGIAAGLSHMKMPGWLDNMLQPLLDRAGQELRRLGEEAIATASAQVKHAIDDGIPRLVNKVGLTADDTATAAGPMGERARFDRPPTM